MIKNGKPLKWIPVSERMPEKCDCYLITVKIKVPDLKPFYKVQAAMFDGRYFDIGYIGGDISVIAWMELPEPYKEVEE